MKNFSNSDYAFYMCSVYQTHWGHIEATKHIACFVIRLTVSDNCLDLSIMHALCHNLWSSPRCSSALCFSSGVWRVKLNQGSTCWITVFYTDKWIEEIGFNQTRKHRPIHAACFSRCWQLTNSSANFIRAALELFVTISAGSWTTGGPCAFQGHCVFNKGHY